MKRKQRLSEIVTAVVEAGELSVIALADRFEVSNATVRRDLELLEKQRLLTRTHGGAVVHEEFNDIPLGYKTAKDIHEKRRIAEAALGFVRGARTIGLTGGTTVREFARLLATRENLTVVTNAHDIASDLAPSLKVFAAGGQVRGSSRESVGPSAEAFVAEYNIDVMFMGVDGVDAKAGCTNYDLEAGSVSDAMRRRARLVVVLADATKISHVAFARTCEMSDVDVLITDDRAPEEALEEIRACGCAIVCV